MKLLKVLIVDDEDGEFKWPKTFSQNLLTVPPAELIEGGYEMMEVMQVTNQQDASMLFANGKKHEYELIFLDLRYPLTPAGWRENEEIETSDYQGVKWLPELRRLQPKATIIIVTHWAEDQNLNNAVRAIRDYGANDFIPKTASFDNIVARIRIAWDNAQRANQLARFEEEFNELIRTRAFRAYAAYLAYSEDVGVLLSQTKTSLFNTARRLESGIPSEITDAPDLIRGQISRLRKEFDELTKLLNEGQGELCEVNVVALVRQMLTLYRPIIDNAQIKVHQPGEDQRAIVNTYTDDLKVALYEVITNAIESLKDSRITPDKQLLVVFVEETDGNVTVRVSDTGGGFSGEDMERLYERGYTTKRDDGKKQGLGLYIARRMMHHIGGDIRAANRQEGGAEVTLTFKDLGQN